jgi:hypothetical protein
LLDLPTSLGELPATLSILYMEIHYIPCRNAVLCLFYST